MKTRRFASILAGLCVLLSLGTLPARAQDAAASEGTGEIQLDLLRFGVGNLARQGSWTGVLVGVTDSGLEQRNVLLRVQGFDPDGDYLQYDRVVTTNPGVGGGTQAFWLYLRLPYELQSIDAIEFRAYEAIESGGDLTRSDLGFTPGKLLGATTPQRGRPLDSSQGLYAVVGPLPMGLNYYDTIPPQSDYPAVAHEPTMLAGSLKTNELPDQWQGYQAFDVLMWGGTGRGQDPGELSTGQAEAIREWVRRGGHFIVVLPSAGAEWAGSANNPIADLLPSAIVSRDEGADLNPYRFLLTRSRQVELPTRSVLHTFAPDPEAPASEAMPILTGPDGRCVVMRRVYGLGAVTVIGIDLSVSQLRDTRMNSPRVLPEAEVFWNRVLGRRGAVSAVDAQTAGINAQSFNKSRTPRVYDGEISEQINKSGTALQGLVLGVGVFFLFWVVAGPGGYGLLTRFKLKRFAWVGFLAATAVFTLIAWTGALALRPKKVDASHFSMTLQVHGSGLERNRTWASVLIPMYGTARVELGRDDGEGALLSPWEPPLVDLGTRHKFPDNRSYRAEAKSPDELRVPSRSTVKQFEIDWVGAPRRGTISVLAKPGDRPTLELVNDEALRWFYVKGEIQHDFPAPLTKVKILVNRGLNPIGSSTLPRSSYADLEVFELTTDLAPGKVYDLGRLTTEVDISTPAKRQSFNGDSFFSRLLRSGVELQAITRTGGSTEDQFTALWLLSQLPPADFASGGGAPGDNLAVRRMTHGLDLGRWFAQPCVIVLGQLQTTRSRTEDQPGPVPLRVNGREAPMSGHSVIAWVYPLPASPPAWSLAAASDPTVTSPAGEAGPEGEDG